MTTILIQIVEIFGDLCLLSKIFYKIKIKFRLFLFSCKKIYNENGSVQNVDYGDICKMGDKVGILLEFTGKGLDVSFFINKLNLGVAFRGLPLNTYYPCVLLYYDGAKVKVTNRVPLPENKV